MSVAADPASGSLMATAIESSPLMISGRYFRLRSVEPSWATTWAGPVFDSKTWKPAGRHTFASSSIATSESRMGAPEPPYSSGSEMPSSPKRPSRRLSSMGKGVRSWSHCRAFGP